MDLTVQAALADPARLRALDATGLLDDLTNEVFEGLTRLVQVCLGVPISLVTLVSDDRQTFQGQAGVPEPWRSVGETPLSHSFCQIVVARDAPFAVDDARANALVRDNLAIADLGVVAYLGLPLRTPDGYVLGALCAIDDAPRAWTAHDVQVLEDLVEVAAAEVAARHRPRGASPDRVGREAALFRALFERVEEAAYVVCADGRVTQANAAALAGRPWSAVVGRPLAVVAPEAVAGLWPVAGADVSLALGTAA